MFSLKFTVTVVLQNMDDKKLVENPSLDINIGLEC